MPKVVLTIDVHHASRGGASEYITQLANFLGHRGYEVVIACHRAEAPAWPTFRLVTPDRPLSSYSPYAQARHLQRWVDREAADLVHDTGASLLRSDLYHPLMGSRLHNEYRQLRAFPWQRALRHVRQTQTWNWARLQWTQCRHHRWLVACSQRVTADFWHFRIPTRAMVPNGIELPAAIDASLLEQTRRELGVGDRLLLLSTSNNHYLKGVMNLLRALDLASPRQRRGWLLVVAGRNDDLAFEGFIQQRGLGDCVRLLSWVADVERYYQAADVFVHPTYHDAGSLSTLKALACGKAVITTCWDGSADRIQDGRNGLVLQSHSPAVLLEALQRVSDPQLREALGQQAAQGRDDLSQRQCFEHLERLYREMLRL